MTPSAADITRKRYWVGALLRAAALSVFLYFLVVATASLWSFLFLPTMAVVKQAVRNELLHIFGPLISTIVLLLLHRRLVRWLLPMPRRECPDCAYPIGTRGPGRCPECGLQLPADLTGPAGVPDPRPDPPRQRP